MCVHRKEEIISHTPLTCIPICPCLMLKTDQGMIMLCTVPVLCISNTSTHTLCYKINHNKIQRLNLRREEEKGQRVTC